MDNSINRDRGFENQVPFQDDSCPVFPRFGKRSFSLGFYARGRAAKKRCVTFKLTHDGEKRSAGSQQFFAGVARACFSSHYFKSLVQRPQGDVVKF